MIISDLASTTIIGLLPELAVSTGAGSLITITHPIFSAQTYQLGASEVSHIFKLNKSNLNYTVTCTFESKVASQVILIDITKQYTLDLPYRVYLYNAGDECSSLTGGWSGGYVWNTHSYWSGTAGTFTKNSDNFYFYAGAYRHMITTRTNNQVNLTDYSTLSFIASTYTASSTYARDYVYINGIYSGSDIGMTKALNISSTGTWSIDISDLSSSYYILIGATSDVNAVASWNMTQMWLEQ